MGSPSITLQASIKSINNMAEGKSGSFSRVVRKKAGRAKEKFLQNFGKADKTTDELFEVYQANFARQRASGTRLQKELQNYATCMRALQAANKGLMDCLTEIYEPEWPGHEQIPVKAATLDLIWDDLCHKLNDQVTIPLSTYLSQFSEIRNKIDKRGRKLVDYDCARHAVESLQRGSGKKDDIKIAKSREQMEEAKRLYEVLNKELHDELPALYDSRIPFMISTLQTLFDSETTFHCEYSKTHAQLRELIDTFALEAQKGSYHTSARHLSVPSAGSGLRTSDSNVRSYEELENKYSTEPSQRGNMSVNKVIVSSNQSNGNSVHHTSGDIRESNDEHSADGVKYLNSETSNDLETSGTQKSEATIVIPPGATTTDLPPGVIYRVRAIYKYIAEDSDELSFEEGEVIRVIEYEDPEEAEDGWLMGIKESTSEKGLFPANFTKPI